MFRSKLAEFDWIVMCNLWHKCALLHSSGHVRIHYTRILFEFNLALKDNKNTRTRPTK